MADRDLRSDDIPGLQEVVDLLKKNKRWIFLGLGVLLVVVLVLKSYFQVEPEEEAIVLRFGAPLAETYGPGLHFKIPFVDVVYTVATERQHRLEFGFRSEPGERTKTLKATVDDESLMLTGDLELVEVQWSVIYKIDDIRTWLFKVEEQEKTIRDVSMSIMRQLVGDYSLNEILTTRKRELQEFAQRETQAVLAHRVPTGVLVTELAIKSTDVPEGAREAFREFNQTEPVVRRSLDEAKAELDRVTGDAEAEKKRAIGEAQRTAEKVVKNARGEAQAFLEQLQEYRLAPGITRQWLYFQTMSKVFAGVDKKLLVDGAGDGGSPMLSLLPLDKMLEGGRVPARKPAGTEEVTP